VREKCTPTTKIISLPTSNKAQRQPENSNKSAAVTSNSERITRNPHHNFKTLLKLAEKKVIFLARFFKFLFRFEFFKKRYFGIYQRVIRPWGLFKNTEIITSYDKTLKIKLSLRDWIQQQIYFFDYYDERGIRFIQSHLKPGDTFVDVGANIGAYALVAAKLVGNDGQVIAFEPVTQVRNRLIENGSLNQLYQLKVESLALFDKNTELALHISSKENFGMSSMHAHDEDSGSTEIVQTARLDDYVEDQFINKIDLIKMDIEGAELFALNGMKSTLMRLKPLVLIEICTEVLEGTDLRTDEIYAFFEDLDYSPYCINEDGNVVNCASQGKSDYTNFVFKPN
jgi:FkbM family methyltransferase